MVCVWAGGLVLVRNLVVNGWAGGGGGGGGSCLSKEPG